MNNRGMCSEAKLARWESENKPYNSDHFKLFLSLNEGQLSWLLQITEISFWFELVQILHVAPDLINIE